MSLIGRAELRAFEKVARPLTWIHRCALWRERDVTPGCPYPHGEMGLATVPTSQPGGASLGCNFSDMTVVFDEPKIGVGGGTGPRC